MDWIAWGCMGELERILKWLGLVEKIGHRKMSWVRCAWRIGWEICVVVVVGLVWHMEVVLSRLVVDFGLVHDDA